MINAAIRDIDALTPETALKCRAFLLRSKAEGLEVFVTETRRSSERQAALWALGRTQPGRIVTHSQAGAGKHEFGIAFDVAFRGENLYPSDFKTWARLGAIGKACGLTWGGDFKGVDSVHFENNGGSMNEYEEASKPVVMTKAAVVVDMVKKVAVPTLKSAKAAAVVSLVVAVLPTVAIVFPQIAPFIGAINAVAKLFGYGV
jgi:peptidoglycan LD-endopeptidase CwlK